jgi:hypothetical protein
MNKSKKSLQVSPVPRNTRISGGGSKKLQVCLSFGSFSLLFRVVAKMDELEAGFHNSNRPATSRSSKSDTGCW